MIDLPHKQIFSVLFAAGEPVETARVAQAIGADEETVLRYLPALQDSLDQAGIPLQILRLGDRLQLSTLEAFAPVIQDALALRRNIPLSQAALEVLAVAAYNQPVTRALIEQVRGVDSSGVVNSLIENQLLEEAGLLVRASVPDGAAAIERITYDSRECVPLTLFACKGAAFRPEYLADAISRGAVCYVSQLEYQVEAAARLQQLPTGSKVCNPVFFCVFV